MKHCVKIIALVVALCGPVAAPQLAEAVEAPAGAEAERAAESRLVEGDERAPVLALAAEEGGASAAAGPAPAVAEGGPAAAEADDPVPGVPTNPAEENPVGTAEQLVENVKAGAWFAAAGGALFFLVAILRWLGRKRALGKSKLWGYVLSFGTALGVSLGASMVAGQFSWEVVVGALGVGWVAGGQLEGATDAWRALKRRMGWGATG